MEGSAPSKPRHIALLTEYDGSAFYGWQTQARGRTVQQVLIASLQELTGENDFHLVGSSRTDSGVHARGHVSHFQTASRIPADRLPLALNTHLPPDLAVLAACDVEADFHARYHALGKKYAYRIWNLDSRPAIDRQRVCHVAGQLDLDQMRQAMPHLIGRHDFRAFMDTGSCDRNPVRTIWSLSLSVAGPLLTLQIEGDGFLYHMVRIIAGTLLWVALGKIKPDSIPEIIRSGDRKLAGKTMPPQGLCLEHVYYDPPLFENYFSRMAEKGEDYVQFKME